MNDSFRHRGKRQNMLNELRSAGIEDEKVLHAMMQIPRHLFLDSAFEAFAYENRAFAIGSGQTISHPFTVGFQTQLLGVEKGQKVLEIGTGSGYQCAVLVALGAEVYTIERHRKLYESSQKMLNKIKFRPRFQSFGDGYKGLPSFAPFDKIIVTAGAPSTPKELLQQLKIGGTMVIPIGDAEQKMTSFLRIDENEFEKLEFGNYQFVPMLEKKV